MLIESLWSLWVAKMVLRFFPFRWIAPRLSKNLKVGIDGVRDEVIKNVGSSIERIAKRLPWQSKCFDKAIAGKLMLRRRGFPSILYLGVKKDEHNQLIAHAWLICAHFPVTGGDFGAYTCVAQFADEI